MQKHQVDNRDALAPVKPTAKSGRIYAKEGFAGGLGRNRLLVFLDSSRGSREIVRGGDSNDGRARSGE